MAILCWDFDGTLALSHHLWSNSVKRAIDIVDPSNQVPFLGIRECMETGFSWQSPHIDYVESSGSDWWIKMNEHFYKSYLSLGVNEDDAKKASEKVKEIIMLPQNYILFETAEYTLKKAKESGHKNILLSNNYPELEVILKALGIDGYFEKIIISACIGYEKPRKEFFDIAKSLYKDEKFFMIGDSLNADIIGGKNAGMTTILVHKGFRDEADYCVDKLSDILKIRGIAK